jgi:type IV pilus assembly protein PilE
MTGSRGFTLIETMIVVAIIGTLFAIALPSYQNYVLRGHRADAQGMLIDIAARQERFLSQNPAAYTTEISAASGLNLGTTTSSGGYYSLEVEACPNGTLATCYLITATALGGQAKDADCLIITYDSRGVRDGTTPDCW